MRIVTTLFFLGLGLSFSAAAVAKIYKWTDANGNTHYTATPPPSKTKTLSKEEFKVRKAPKSALKQSADTPKNTNQSSTSENNKTITTEKQHAQAQCRKAIRKAPALEKGIQQQLSRAVQSGKVPKERLEEFKRQKSAGKFKAPSMRACIKDYLAGGSGHTDTVADNNASSAVSRLQLEKSLGL